MLTNNTYKNYSNQIAALFCSESDNKVLCTASVSERLKTFLDDVTFPVFLSKLSEGGRMYITTFEQFQNRGFRIVLVDLITGERTTAWWEVPYNYPYLGILPGKLSSHRYEIISQNKTYNELNKGDVRITYNSLKPGYGITFVPYTPPGVVPGGGTPGGGPPGGTIKTTPPVVPDLPVNKAGLFPDMDMTTILIIGGVGIAAWYLLKK